MVGGEIGVKPRHSDSSAKATWDYTDRSEKEKNLLKVYWRNVCHSSKQKSEAWGKDGRGYCKSKKYCLSMVPEPPVISLSLMSLHVLVSIFLDSSLSLYSIFYLLCQ